MKICICDGKKSVHEEIKKLILSFRTEENSFEITDFSNGKEILNSYENGKNYDIVFLEIEMTDLNGIEVAERIKEISPKSIIIFVSGYTDFIFEAFRIEALHFIVKPIKEHEFNEVFDRAIKKFLTVSSTLVLKWQSERYCIPVDEISFIEGYRRHLTVHTASRTYEAVGKLSEVFETLCHHGFVRSHQGFIVNMHYIKNFGINDLELTDGSKVMLSVRKRQEALKIYDTFLQKRR